MKRKRLLISGGAGFIGHHIIDLFLRNTDWDIVSLDRLDYSGNLNRLDNVVSSFPPETRKRVRIVWHDLKAEISSLTSNFIGDVNIILHLAASSHVDRSITHPMEFVLDNTVGTVNVLEYARKLKNLERMIYFNTDEIFGIAPPGVAYKERDRYNSTNPYSASKAAGGEFAVAYENTYKLPIFVTNCHDEKTNCWSEHGIVSVDQLAIGDKIWTLRDNKTLVLEPIQEIIQSYYEGDMYEFVSQKYNLCVTPNHRMVTKIRNKEKDWLIRTAEEMFKINNRQHIPVTGDWNGIDIESITMKDFIDVDNLHHNANEIPKTINTVAFMKFLGWYISEGCTCVGEVKVFQKKHSIDGIMEIVDNIGFTPSLYQREDGVNACSFQSKDFAEFLADYFGKNSANKRISVWVKNLHKKYLRVLFDYLMMGDGSITKGYKRYYTISKNLAEDVAEIGIKIGYSTSIKTRYTWDFQKRFKRKSYYVSFRNSNVGIDINNKKKTHYEGKIWCVRTASGNFFVERNGIISCSGNTMNVFGERQHPEKFIPMCIRKVRDDEKIYIHSDATKTIPGSRFYIHAKDVAAAMYFLLHLSPDQLKEVYKPDYGGAKCPKFNIVGKEEINNLQMVELIAKAQNKTPKYEMVDFHTSRPGHDLRYALDGGYMRSLGWEPKVSLQERINEVVSFSLLNPEWIEING
jgi:dTDP-D-glucose 4,6-dehydratase